MIVREKVPISSLTTMRLGGVADYVIEVENRDDIRAAYAFAKELGLPVWVLGRGANTIGRDEGFRGVIILNKISGIELQEKTDEYIILRANGGEKWDDFVAYACETGYSGIETLSMIPGTVGAAPVQNIGAYGSDIADVIISLEAYDTVEDKYAELDKSEMAMEYRHTRFNFGEDAGRFFIIAITIRLTRTQLKPPFYNSLQVYIDQRGETDFSPQNIRSMICRIRGEKLPDPDKIASAGSFFKNIYLDRSAADEAERKGIPVWRDEAGGKINSGWLIEQCGLKGKLLHGFRVSDKAALVLINETAESYADLAKARAEIIEIVKQRFGYTLEQEPVEIPTDASPRSTL